MLIQAQGKAMPTEAETQGRTDETIGAWLKKRGRRDDVILASKICGASHVRPATSASTGP